MNPKAGNDLSSLTSEQAYERIRRDLERSALLASTAVETSVKATAKFTLSVFTAREQGS